MLFCIFLLVVVLWWVLIGIEGGIAVDFLGVVMLVMEVCCDDSLCLMWLVARRVVGLYLEIGEYPVVCLVPTGRTSVLAV